jgi:hypothetical protein
MSETKFCTNRGHYVSLNTNHRKIVGNNCFHLYQIYVLCYMGVTVFLPLFAFERNYNI